MTIVAVALGAWSCTGSGAPEETAACFEPETLNELAQAWADGGKALEREDWPTAGWAFERVLAIDPAEEVARHLAAVARARMDARTDTLQHLRHLLELGSDLVPHREALGPLGDDEEVRSVIAEAEAGARSLGEAAVALRIDIPDLYPEGIAWDPLSGSLLIGSLHHRAILRVHPGDVSPPTVEALVGPSNPDLGGVVGMRVDAERRDLWVATGMTPLAMGFEKSQIGRSWLLRVDLDTGALKGRWDPPADGSSHELNDLAVDLDGGVWITDTYTGALYSLSPGSDTLEVAQPAGTFVWPNGIAVSEDGRGLWVADWRNGVTHLDLETGRRSRLTHPPGVSIHGFDGLYAHRGDLVGILNPVQPARVVRLRLAGGEPRVVAQELLVSRHPSFEDPTTGAITGEAIWVIANSQIRRVDPEGRALAPAGLQPIELLLVELS